MLKVNILTGRGEAFHVDTLNLDSARQRAITRPARHTAPTSGAVVESRFEPVTSSVSLAEVKDLITDLQQDLATGCRS